MEKYFTKYSYGEKVMLDDIKPLKFREEKELNDIFKLSFKEFYEILEKFIEFIDCNKDYEYETIYWDGVKKVIKLGESYDLSPFDRNSNSILNYPLGEEIVKFKNDIGLSTAMLIQIDYYLEIVDRIAYAYSPRYLAFANKVLERFIDLDELSEFAKDFKSLKHRNKIIAYIKLLLENDDKHSRFNSLKDISEIIFFMISEEEMRLPYLVRGDSYFYGSSKDLLVCSREVSYFLRKLQDLACEDEFFYDYFKICYNYYRKSGYEDYATLNQSSFIKWENKMVGVL